MRATRGVAVAGWGVQHTRGSGAAMGVAMLRRQLANLGVTPSWYKKRGRDGVKAYLSASELRELVGRLKVVQWG